jgi:hypothetical protein
MNPISVPACEVNTAAEGWNVGLLPGAFPSDETLHNTVDYSHGVCLQATNIPLPLQSVREIQQLEAEPVSISVRHGGRELHSAKVHELPGAPGVKGGGYISPI